MSDRFTVDQPWIGFCKQRTPKRVRLSTALLAAVLPNCPPVAAPQDLLSLLSIAGVPVSVAAAAKALEIPPGEVMAAAAELQKAGAVIESGTGYALASDQTVEVSPAVGAYLAGRLAEVLEAGPVVAGRLLLKAGRAEEAWVVLSRAALARDHRRHDAERTELIDLALQSLEAAGLEGGEAEGDLLLQLAMLHRSAGRSTEARTEVEKAVRLLRGEHLVDALGFAAAVADDRQHPQESERWVALAESAAASLGSLAKLGSLLTFHGRELSRLGFAAEAEAALQKGTALLEAHGSEVQLFYGRLNRAWVELDQGNTRQAEMDFAGLVEKAGTLEGEASLASNQAYLARALYGSGRPDQADETARQALATAARVDATAAKMIAHMGQAEGALLFDRAEAALEAADAALADSLERLPAWENATRYLRARALWAGGWAGEARAEADLALTATPAGGDGLRWRSRIEALQLELADTWDHNRAVDLTDRLLQSRWLGAAVELMTVRARRDKDPELAAEAAALAMQIGNVVQAGKAIDAGKLWDDPLAVTVTAGLHNLPPDWLPGFLGLPEAAKAMESAGVVSDEDVALLRSRIDQAMETAGLAGDFVLSPAQRRAAGLVRPRRRRRPVWQVAAGIVGVAALAVASAAVAVNVLTPPPPSTTTTSRTTTTAAVLAIEETQVPAPETRITGNFAVRGGAARVGTAEGGFRNMTGYYWRETPGASIVSSAIAQGPYGYVATEENIVYGLDLTSQLLNLTVQAEGAITSDLAVGLPATLGDVQPDPALVFVTNDGVAYAYNALRSGSPSWQTPIGHVRGAPLIAGPLAVFATTEGDLIALDLALGHEVWRLDTEGSFLGSPAESKGIVYAAAREGLLYSVSAETGVPVCESPVELVGTAVANPVVTDQVLFVGLETPPGTHAFAAGACGTPADGYSSFYPASEPMRLGPVATPDTLYLVESRLLVALSLEGSLWESAEGLLISPWEEPFAADNLITTAPVLAGDLLYVGSQSGTVYAID
ncbi:MAG: outer membrane protein assembly factor BamB family protein, partial [Actinomycetota bacterium]